MKKPITLAQALATPLKMAKLIDSLMEAGASNAEITAAVKDNAAFQELAGPLSSDRKSSYTLKDDITVDYYDVVEKPDGTYLVTLKHKYLEEYKVGLYVRVLTRGLKQKMKYNSSILNKRITVKGDLDVMVIPNMVFTTEDGRTLPARLGIAVTIIDLI